MPSTIQAQEMVDALAAISNWIGIYEKQDDSLTRRVAFNAAARGIEQLSNIPARLQALQAALGEALDEWQSWLGDETIFAIELKRIAELRKLTGEP